MSSLENITQYRPRAISRCPRMASCNKLCIRALNPRRIRSLYSSTYIRVLLLCLMFSNSFVSSSSSMVINFGILGVEAAVLAPQIGIQSESREGTAHTPPVLVLEFLVGEDEVDSDNYMGNEKQNTDLGNEKDDMDMAMDTEVDLVPCPWPMKGGEVCYWRGWRGDETEIFIYQLPGGEGSGRAERERRNKSLEGMENRDGLYRQEGIKESIKVKGIPARYGKEGNSKSEVKEKDNFVRGGGGEEIHAQGMPDAVDNSDNYEFGELFGGKENAKLQQSNELNQQPVRRPIIQ